MTKEEIYERDISPLMSQVYQLCQKHKIAVLACFDIRNERHPGRLWLETLLTEDYDPPPCMLEALSVFAFATRNVIPQRQSDHTHDN